MNNSKPQVIGKLDNHPFITCAAHQGASINALEGQKRPNEEMIKNGSYKLTMIYAGVYVKRK